MADLHHPTRGGTRGGAGEFRWDNVKGDKDRENYLGHSINAPTGRWQNNRDVHWYSRQIETDEQARERQRLEEIKKQKELEENALSIALGYGPTIKEEGAEEDGEGTGANSVPVKKSEKELEMERLEKEEKKRRKELKAEQKEYRKIEKEVKKEIKREEKERRRAEKHRHRSRSPDDRRRYEDDRDGHRSREQEDRYGRGDRDHERRSGRRENSRSRSRSPPRGDGGRERRESFGRSGNAKQDFRRSDSRPHDNDRGDRPYHSRKDKSKADEYDFEAERAKERQRWEKYHDRDKGMGTDWGRGGGFDRR